VGDAYLSMTVASGSFSLVQWSPRKKLISEAEPYPVAEGQVTTVDERFLPHGTISGRLTKGGSPVISTLVMAENPVDGSPVGNGYTDANGDYRLNVWTGDYVVQFGSEDWAHNADTREQGQVFTVTDGANLVVNEDILLEGNVQGRLLDAAGVPVTNAQVEVANHALSRYYYAYTDDNGDWSISSIRPGTYVVRYNIATQVQWTHNKTTSASADPITVTSSQTTVVGDERFLPTGSLTITATDATTRRPVRAFCAEVTSTFHSGNVCAENGTAEVPKIGQGTYRVTIKADGYVEEVVTGVRVAGGKRTRTNVQISAGATIIATMVDAKTGAKIDGACAIAVPADRPMGYTPGDGINDCSGADGVATLTNVRPDAYNLFVSAYDGVHGAQWVGPSGGTGAQEAARDITSRAGDTVRVTVKLDGQGSITGVVTDRATGREVTGVVVSTGQTFGESDYQTGRYTITNLGPYDWPLHFVRDGYAAEWFGGGADRAAATRVRVRVGAATQADFKMRTGVLVTGTLTSPTGQLPQFGAVSVYDAETFDFLGSVLVDASGRFSVRVLGGQRVKLQVGAMFNGSYVSNFWPDQENFALARAVHVPPTGTLSLNLTIIPQ
jgi:hypothetical protein